MGAGVVFCARTIGAGCAVFVAKAFVAKVFVEMVFVEMVLAEVFVESVELSTGAIEP